MRRQDHKNTSVARFLGGAAAAALLTALAACAQVMAPEVVEVTGPVPERATDPDAHTTVIAAYRYACLETPLDLDGAEEALLDLGFQPAPTPEDAAIKDLRIFAKGDVEAELRLGIQRPVVVSNCLISSPSLDRDAALAALETSLVASGMRYEARDLARLGDPRAHDVRGTAIGSNFWGVVSVIDVKGLRGAALLKTPPKRN